MIAGAGSLLPIKSQFFHFVIQQLAMNLGMLAMLINFSEILNFTLLFHCCPLNLSLLFHHWPLNLSLL